MKSTQNALYLTHNNMKQRCDNPNNPQYKDYGGRGIAYCDKWKNFKGFYEDMGDRPSPRHTLDRIDNDGNYCKENCRWATRDLQAYNRRSTNRTGLKYFGIRESNPPSGKLRYMIEVPPFEPFRSVNLEKALAILTCRISSKEHKDLLNGVVQLPIEKRRVRIRK